jgi:hypothetical protein
MSDPSLFDQTPEDVCRHGRRPGEACLWGCHTDPAPAAEAKADGIQRADDHANERWKTDAYNAVRFLATAGFPFTADDVWAQLSGQGVDSSTHEPSALGPIFLKASRNKIIVKTGRLVPTRYARRHRDLTEWVGR